MVGGGWQGAAGMSGPGTVPFANRCPCASACPCACSRLDPCPCPCPLPLPLFLPLLPVAPLSLASARFPAALLSASPPPTPPPSAPTLDPGIALPSFILTNPSILAPGINLTSSLLRALVMIDIVCCCSCCCCAAPAPDRAPLSSIEGAKSAQSFSSCSASVAPSSGTQSSCAPAPAAAAEELVPAAAAASTEGAGDEARGAFLPLPVALPLPVPAFALAAVDGVESTGTAPICAVDDTPEAADDEAAAGLWGAWRMAERDGRGCMSTGLRRRRGMAG